ncbi:MAG: LicD family protein [Muribaculaceae bacterium]|uniref:LicD family protein n=1 Tax=Bacteroides acidifaciens TaxID=85831 RepID=UPI002576424C|nr:LicD family protein [Bacteroides acidifaciens]
MKNLMRSYKEDKWGILELQNCILNIAEYIDTFCDKYGIDYCLMGGSALGAVRHKGFIPWDDDLDIFMRPKEYEKFRKEFLKNGDKSRFYLQEWGSKKGMPTIAKLRLNQSHYIESDFENLDVHKGVFVDIFILHSCPDSIYGHMNQYFWSRYLVLKSLANRNYSRRGLLASLILKPLRWLPKRAFVDFAINQIYKNSTKITKYFCHYLGRAGYKKGLYKSDFFLHTKKVPFESIELRVPYKVEDYLKERWGDYMKLPSEEEIRYYQHSSGWSVEKTFAGYNKDGVYTDEINLIS